MKDKRKERQFDPRNYPALREFCPAYLHQDFEDEYGSAAEALKGFLADASRDEIVKVKEEWAALRKALHGRPFAKFLGSQKRHRVAGGGRSPRPHVDVESVNSVTPFVKHDGVS